MVVKANPVTNEPTGALQGFIALAVHALILQGAEHPLSHSVLLRVGGCDEFLRQAIAFDQCGVIPAAKHQAIV